MFPGFRGEGGGDWRAGLAAFGGGATDDTSGSGDMAAGVSGVGVSVGLAATGSGGVAGAVAAAGDSGGLGIHEVPALGISRRIYTLPCGFTRMRAR
ncbi:hypothetical protein [Mobiluncus mulieris]|uniref:hypothetical protein n=1 Tax=Mobiluncus mulieris TaxID=2052 RepID=UPI0020921308|nr:hypothetical protein [Mobiluncus mulieris]